MKLIAAFIFLFASVVSTPTPCSHAMGLDGANDASLAMKDSNTHSDSQAHRGMDHHAPEAGDGHAAADNQYHGCANGCDGGVGCEGCTITSSAISTADEFFRKFVAHSALIATLVAGTDKSVILDPPPPRA